MKSLVRFQLTAIAAIMVLASVVIGQTTVVATPNELPTSAYANGADGDHPYIQSVHVTLDAAAGNGDNVTITLPTPITVADMDNDGNYDDEVYILWANAAGSGATTLAVDATTSATAVVIDITAADGMTTADDIVVTFPVETTGTATASLTYSVTWDGNAGTGTSNAVATVANVTLFSYDGTYLNDRAGGKITTNNRGSRHPDAVGAIAYTAVGTSIIEDGFGAFGNASNEVTAGNDWLAPTFDGTDDNGEVTYSLWASQSDTLRRVNGGSGELVINFNTNNPIAAANEAAAITTAASGSMDASLFAEGNWWIYITSNVTDEWVLNWSDTLAVRHWPTFIDPTTSPTTVATGANAGEGSGVDYDHDGLYEITTAGDDAQTTMTLESGGIIGINGSLVAASNSYDNANFIWHLEDIDGNPRVRVFYSTVSTLGSVDSIQTSGGLVTGLGTGGNAATELTTTAIYEESATNTINWDIYTAPTFLTAADYYFYVVAYDGTNKAVDRIGNDAGAVLTVTAQHYPFIGFHDLAGGDLTAISTADDQYIPLSWGETVDGDLDPDAAGTAVIRLYAVNEATAVYDGIVSVNDPTLTLSNTQLIANGTLLTTITDSSDTKGANSYMYDIRAAGLAAATYSFYASITHGSDVLVMQYNSSQGVVPGASEDNRSFLLTNPQRMFPKNPVEGSVVTLNTDDRYQFEWDAFDADATLANKDVIMFMAPVNTVTSTISVLDAANTAGYFFLTSTTGLAPNSLVNGNTQVLTVDFATIVADLAGNAVSPSGAYYVYYYYVTDGGGIADNTETPVLADGTLNFNAVAPDAVNFELSPNQAVLMDGDTITVTILARENLADNPEFLNIHLDIPSTYISMVDQDASTAGTQPILNETAIFAGTVTENTVTTSGGSHSINFLQWASGGDDIGNTAVAVGSFQLAVTSQPTTGGFSEQLVTFGTSGSRVTGMISASGITMSTATPATAGNFRLAQAGKITGQILLEARAELGTIVTIKVTPEGSYTPITDAAFVLANDDASQDGSDGIQYTLAAGGEYTLTSVPFGQYDISVHYDSHLDQLNTNVAVQPLSTTTSNFSGGDELLAGDVAGYDHDNSSSTFSQPDNEIDTDDTGAITTAFNATSDSSNWNAYADVDGNGTVYIPDLNYAATNTGNGEGARYKRMGASNEDALGRMDLLERTGDEYIYVISARNLGSLHAYAAEISFSGEDWDFAGYTDGLRAVDNTVNLARMYQHSGTIASAIIGHRIDTHAERDLATITLRAKVSNPVDPELALLTLVDGRMVTEQAILESIDNSVPTRFDLSQNYPNPFNPNTTITFTLPVEGYVNVAVYNLLGQEIATLTSGMMEQGAYRVVWNAVDNSGRKAATGMYFYRMIVDGKIIATKKMLLLK